jgi:hypothetical protein
VKTIELGTIQIGNVYGKTVEDITDQGLASYLFISIPFALLPTRQAWYLSIGMPPRTLGLEWRLRIERYDTSFVDLCEL